MGDTAFLNIDRVVSTALNQTTLAGLSAMLRSICEAVDAYGCILWQVVPGANLAAQPPAGYLFVLAEWFPGSKRDALHDLPINQSVTGNVVVTERTANIEDISVETRVYPDPFLEETGIKSLCSVPIRFREGPRGAVSVYRTRGEAFGDSELADLERLAALVPALYQAIRDKVSLDVIANLNTILHEAEIRSTEIEAELPSKGAMKALIQKQGREVIQRICDLVTETFRCVETSVILEDRLERPAVYELMATTWPDPIIKREFKRNAQDGLTGWVLAHAKPVKIFDLKHFERDRAAILEQYEGITWSDSLNIQESVMRFRRLSSEKELPPLSFLAAPILKGEELLGVIRCSVANESPYYFADLALRLLELVAAQIGNYWATRVEIQSWQAWVDSVSDLNSIGQKELAKPSQENDTVFKSAIFKKALLVAREAIKGAEILDVRLLDEDTRELFFARTFGQAWNAGSRDEVEARRRKRYPVDDPTHDSAGASVFRTGEVRVMRNVRECEDYSETFHDTKRMIIAPIKVEDKTYGVLDIRGVSECEFPTHAGAIAQLLAQQLGLYIFLKDTIDQVARARDRQSKLVQELRDTKDEAIRTFQDLAHQFKSPIIQAQRTIQSVIDNTPDKDNRKQDLWATRGLCVKAKNVSFMTNLFAALSRGENVSIKETDKLTYDELMKMLLEAAIDNERIRSPRGIKFDVDWKSFQEHKPQKSRMRQLYANRNLLEQAIANVLDNAGKYSFKNRRVRIYGGRTSGDGFHVSVENFGIRIRENERELCVRRGWQSEDAMATSGEGKGIGLWIVDHIMKAHNGQLILSPTKPDDLTEVRLLFPQARVK